MKLLSSEVQPGESYFCKASELDMDAVNAFMALLSNGTPMIVTAMPDTRQAEIHKLLANRYPAAITLTIAPSATRMGQLTGQLAEADGSHQLKLLAGNKDCRQLGLGYSEARVATQDPATSSCKLHTAVHAHTSCVRAHTHIYRKAPAARRRHEPPTGLPLMVCERL